MGDERYVDAIPPEEDISDRELFDELIGKPALDLALLQHGECDDADERKYCREMAVDLQRMVGELHASTGRPKSKLQEGEIELLNASADHLMGLSQLFVDVSAKLSSFSDRGEALDSVGELLACAFYIGKFTSLSERVASGKKLGRVPAARRRIAAKLRELYQDDPIKSGLKKKVAIIQEVKASLDEPVSESTFDRARDLAWHSDAN